MGLDDISAPTSTAPLERCYIVSENCEHEINNQLSGERKTDLSKDIKSHISKLIEKVLEKLCEDESVSGR